MDFAQSRVGIRHPRVQVVFLIVFLVDFSRLNVRSYRMNVRFDYSLQALKFRVCISVVKIMYLGNVLECERGEFHFIFTRLYCDVGSRGLFFLSASTGYLTRSFLGNHCIVLVVLLVFDATSVRILLYSISTFIVRTEINWGGGYVNSDFLLCLYPGLFHNLKSFPPIVIFFILKSPETRKEDLGMVTDYLCPSSRKDGWYYLYEYFYVAYNDLKTLNDNSSELTMFSKFRYNQTFFQYAD